MGDDARVKEEISAAYALRRKGWAVVLFDPEELGGADPGYTEDRLIELGFEVIDTLKSMQE